jgi:uncharacterized zinc-type alcohol dehydrogenase-like protein
VRAASQIADDPDVVVIGSQSILAAIPEDRLPREAAASMEVDVAFFNDPDNFCAEHGIACEVEIIGAEQINEAWKRVLASDVRFRFVIDISTLASQSTP